MNAKHTIPKLTAVATAALLAAALSLPAMAYADAYTATGLATQSQKVTLQASKAKKAKKVSFKRGATKMPIASTSKWKLENCKLKVLSGKAVKVKGATVTAKRKGTATIGVVPNGKKKPVSKVKVRVYDLGNVHYQLKSAAKGENTLTYTGYAKFKKHSPLLNKLQFFRFKRTGNTYEIIFADVPDWDFVPLKWDDGKSISKLAVKGDSKEFNAAIDTYVPGRNKLKSCKWRIRVDDKNNLQFVNVNSGMAITRYDGPSAGSSVQKGHAVQTIARDSVSFDVSTRSQFFTLTPETVYPDERYKPKYDYELYYLKTDNGGSKWYSDADENLNSMMRLVYLKTNNPDPETFRLRTKTSGKFVRDYVHDDYDDVEYRYRDDEDRARDAWLPVPGGYISSWGIPRPGTYTMIVTEYHSRERQYSDLCMESERAGAADVTELGTFTVQDYATEEDAWIRKTLAECTKPSMDPLEKLEAFMAATSDFKYVPVDKDGESLLLSRLREPYWVSKRWDSAVAPSALAKVATDYIGGFDEIERGDGSSHALVFVTYKGVRHELRPCPAYGTGRVDPVPMVDFDDPNRFQLIAKGITYK